jgi:hypothetical protein
LLESGAQELDEYGIYSADDYGMDAKEEGLTHLNVANDVSNALSPTIIRYTHPVPLLVTRLAFPIRRPILIPPYPQYNRSENNHSPRRGIIRLSPTSLLQPSI